MKTNIFRGVESDGVGSSLGLGSIWSPLDVTQRSLLFSFSFQNLFSVLLFAQFDIADFFPLLRRLITAADVNLFLFHFSRQIGVSKSTVGGPSISNPREKLKKKMQLLLNKQCELMNVFPVAQVH